MIPFDRTRGSLCHALLCCLHYETSKSRLEIRYLGRRPLGEDLEDLPQQALPVRPGPPRRPAGPGNRPAPAGGRAVVVVASAPAVVGAVDLDHESLPLPEEIDFVAEQGDVRCWDRKPVGRDRSGGAGLRGASEPRSRGSRLRAEQVAEDGDVAMVACRRTQGMAGGPDRGCPGTRPPRRPAGASLRLHPGVEIDEGSGRRGHRDAAVDRRDRRPEDPVEWITARPASGGMALGWSRGSPTRDQTSARRAEDDSLQLGGSSGG